MLISNHNCRNRIAKKSLCSCAILLDKTHYMAIGEIFYGKKMTVLTSVQRMFNSFTMINIAYRSLLEVIGDEIYYCLRVEPLCLACEIGDPSQHHHSCMEPLEDMLLEQFEDIIQTMDNKTILEQWNTNLSQRSIDVDILYLPEEWRRDNYFLYDIQEYILQK